MSPASRSIHKDKSSSTRAAAKEQQKASFKPSAPGTVGNGITASAYNPLSGTFHTLEASPTASSPPAHGNGRFRNMDETDDHSGSSLGTGAEYDSVSNNDSCSGESEDQKEKTATTTVRQEAIPGSDNDKREKIRQKNERKHQRQREKRAQELHERCNGFLMSRKLEALAQQLVAMGFSSERAMMALMSNEGRIEESVAWLFESGEEAVENKNSNLQSGKNLKIDITEELSRIADMEVTYKCSKQEVERAVVACEGDLEKAVETLRAQKQELTASLSKPEENGGKVAVSVGQNLMRPPTMTNTSVTIQQRRDERNFNYTKAAPLTMLASLESANGNLQSLRRIQLKSEWAKPQAAVSVDKRWPSMGSSPVSHSSAPPLQIAPATTKSEARYVIVGSEVKNLQTGTLKGPVIMMQRPQSINAKQSPVPTSISASPPVTSTGWYPNNVVAAVENMRSNGGLMQGPTTMSLNPNPNGLSSHQFYHQPQYHSVVSNPMESPAVGWGASWSTTGTTTSSSSPLSIPPALGLFSGWGSTGSSGSSSPVDWKSGGSMAQCNYNNIDWSLESTSPPRSSGLCLSLASFVKNGQTYESWSPSTSVSTKSSMRSASLNGICTVGLSDGVGVESSSTSTSEGPCEWTSPFAGKDIFSIPRQFVTSPSL